MNIDRLDSLGYNSRTSLRSGLDATYADFLKNRQTLRM